MTASGQDLHFRALGNSSVQPGLEQHSSRRVSAIFSLKFPLSRFCLSGEPLWTCQNHHRVKLCNKIPAPPCFQCWYRESLFPLYLERKDSSCSAKSKQVTPMDQWLHGVKTGTHRRCISDSTVPQGARLKQQAFCSHTPCLLNHPCSGLTPCPGCHGSTSYSWLILQETKT